MRSSGKQVTPLRASANANNNLTLTTTPTAVPNMSISLTPGVWLVIATFDFQASGEAGQVALGSITSSGGTVTIHDSAAIATFGLGTAGDRATVSQCWTVTVTATTTIAGQAAKTGGAGSSAAGTVHSTLRAIGGRF